MKVSSGSYDFNKWLYGGYENGIITTIYGPAGSGKTNLCLIAAVSQAKKGNKVLFVDTEGGFSTERIKQLAQEDFESVLGNILVLKPTSFSEQKDAFKELLKQVTKEHFGLIIVDGMTMLYRLDFGVAKDEGADSVREINAHLARQMSILSEIAIKQDLPVIVTNQTYKWDNESRMVAGDVMKYWSKCLIELTSDNGGRTAFLRKHRSLPEKSLPFQIVNGGVKKRGWL